MLGRLRSITSSSGVGKLIAHLCDQVGVIPRLPVTDRVLSQHVTSHVFFGPETAADAAHHGLALDLLLGLARLQVANLDVLVAVVAVDAGPLVLPHGCGTRKQHLAELAGMLEVELKRSIT